MPEYRQNPVTGQWVIVAKERAKRPDDFVKRGVGSPAECPFDYGHEAMTPPETLAFRPDGSPANTPGWTVRVVPNKFAALTPENDEETVNGIYRSRNAYGAHEVVIHGPSHDLTLATYPVEQTIEVLKAYQLRYDFHKSRPYGRYIQIIVNHGGEAGASLEHSHSQIFAVSVVPERLRAELEGAAAYFDANGRCVYCDMVGAELSQGARVVDRSEHFIAFVPYAAKLPFETHILPVRHRSHFETLSDEERVDLAVLFRNTLRRFYNGLDNPPFNMYIHTVPTGYERNEAYHWHMSIIPKLTIPAGFEMSTGMTINITIPENSAEFLRSTRV